MAEYKPVGVAIVGIGWWSTIHANALKKTKKLRLVTCYTRSREKAVKFSAENGCDYEESYEAVLKRDDVEAIILITPHTTHTELALKAAESGKHVLVEKPLANTVEECKRIIDGCKRTGVVLAVAHDRRRLMRHRIMKSILDDGSLGTPLMAEANYSSNLGLALTPEKWRWYRSESPAGPMMSLGIHHVDTLQYLLGPIEEVFSFITKRAVKGELDDTVCATFRFKSGVLASLTSTFASPRTFYLNIYGTELNVYSDERTGLHVLKKDAQSLEKVTYEEVDAVQVEQEDFADAIRLKRRPEVGGEEGMMNVAAVEAMLKSFEEKRVVGMDEVL